MFKHYKDLCDVVSLIVYCPNDGSYLFTKEGSGETWLPSSKCEKNCWKMTAHKIYFELFGVDSGTSCHHIRMVKIWLPNHALPCVYHAVYKAAVKTDIKKRLKNKGGLRSRLQWLNQVEVARQRAHSCFRSPEILVITLMVNADGRVDKDLAELESSALVEICEENVVVGMDVAGGAVAMASPNLHLLQAAGYNRDGYAARHNVAPPFTANKMLTLLHQACEHIKAEDWKKVVEKTKNVIQNDWERDVNFDSICDQELIINLQDCSSDESDFEIDLGCTPLSQ